MTTLEIWQVYGWPLLWVILKVLFIALPVLIPVAYASYYQRKIMAVMQLRRGPNVIGPWGLLQPAADGLKLLLKEWIIPYAVDKPTFLLAPLLSLVLMFIAWAVIPFSENLVLADINMGVLYIMAISAVDVYAILIAGWASRSRYAFLGGLRSSAQMISYEVSMGLIICCILLLTHSLNLTEIVKSQQNVWYIVVLFPIAIIFFISILAETSRHPFDLPEAESELVAGYNVEYSGALFAMFQMAEYGNTFVMSSFFTVLFLGGWLPLIDIAPFNLIPGVVWFILKVMFVVFVIYWIQATLPRYRYDQLMRLGWKVFLPLTLFAFILLAFILRYS